MDESGGRTDREGTVIRTFITQPGSYAVMTREKQFADVPAGSWASDAIRQLGALQVINGTDAEHFAPNRSITRGEFAAMLAKALELPATEIGRLRTCGPTLIMRGRSPQRRRPA